MKKILLCLILVLGMSGASVVAFGQTAAPGTVAPSTAAGNAKTKAPLVSIPRYGEIRTPRWSPDGDWLAFNVMDTDLYITPITQGLVNAGTCQVIPLKGLDGEIEGWLK